MKFLLIIVGFYISFYIIAWLIRIISNFLETKRYRVKLKKMTPQLKAINTEELSSEFLSIKESYLSLLTLLRQQYKISDEDEQIDNIDEYIEEEADYRRSIRKSPKKRTRHRKHRRYGGRYNV